MCTSYSVMEGQRHNNPLTRIAFVYKGPKGMELAPNPRYSGGSKSSRRLISISYASAKTCKGDELTAQGNTKGWGHINKLKQYKHTKYKPRLNINTLGPTGLYELVLVAVHMENFRCTA